MKDLSLSINNIPKALSNLNYFFLGIGEIVSNAAPNLLGILN